MRAGGCTVQQALTPEAATIVKQAVNLARRRGHAQVTPLHVANTMLCSAAGLLRAACLQSHSHPLQCKALELCFNVALNRLPASSSAGPMLGPHHHHHHHHHPPSLSNALVAAFKRAQAHQRRGSIESQQQPLLAVKIELEQLIISILDDPSVSRVMREAGFSSTQVKSNVEQAVSLEICGTTTTTTTTTPPPPPPNPNSVKPKEVVMNKPRPPLDHVRSEDITSVMDCLVSRRKRSFVVVGECLETSEGVVRVVMDRVCNGEGSHESLRNLQFIPLPISSFRNMTREEVDHKVGELRCLVKTSCSMGRGAVLVLEDLNWVAEFWAGDHLEKQRGYSYYCPVEHVIMEVRSLLYCGGLLLGGERLCLMGFATYQTYMGCRVGNPSLEALWGLQTLTIPAGALELSLNCDSDSQSQMMGKRSGNGACWSFIEGGVVENTQLTCCAECSIKFDAEARSLPNNSFSNRSSISSSSLPSWLRQDNRSANSNDQGCLQLKDLCKKWNSICNTSHRNQHNLSEMTLNFSSVPPSSSISSYYDHCYPSLHQPWPLPLEPKHPWREHHVWLSGASDEVHEQNSRFYLRDNEPNPNPNPNSSSSNGSMDQVEHSHPKFKEINAENLKTLCNALEKRVAWQSDIIPDIASTILQCRSGMVRRKEKSKLVETKEETWFFFQGNDTDGKERIARELARLVFGSYNKCASIKLSNFLPTRSDSTDDFRNKRSRSEKSHSYLEELFEAICDNPHRVFLLQDIEQLDYYSQVGIKAAMESGVVHNYNGDEVSVSDAILILSCEMFDSRSRACSPPAKERVESEEEEEGGGGSDDKEMGSYACLDLNLCAEDDMECSSDDVGLLEAVDRAFFFRLPEDL
ncbi:protein SMAX1-LIKE 3-like [Typha angustifolia]|uniref:protein SMAX1-LIKE 3-like n=1 Tax=Typha angustifolia TaxID=59011 RepID=UPI003C300AD5